MGRFGRRIQKFLIKPRLRKAVGPEEGAGSKNYCLFLSAHSLSSYLYAHLISTSYLSSLQFVSSLPLYTERTQILSVRVVSNQIS